MPLETSHLSQTLRQVRGLSLDNIGQDIQKSQCEHEGQQGIWRAGGVPRPCSQCAKGSSKGHWESHYSSSRESELSKSFSNRECHCVHSGIISKHLANVRKIHQPFCLVLEKDTLKKSIGTVVSTFQTNGASFMWSKVPNQILSNMDSVTHYRIGFTLENLVTFAMGLSIRL